MPVAIWDLEVEQVHVDGLTRELPGISGDRHQMPNKLALEYIAAYTL